MNILFLHKTFPGQFKHIVSELAKDSENTIYFITQDDSVQIAGVNKITYKPKRSVSTNCNPYLPPYEEAVIQNQAGAKAALKLKNQGFKPDIIIGHSIGATMFMKDVFPDTPLLGYFEWYYNSEGADLGFDGNPVSEDEKAKLRCKNSDILVDLYSSDAGICPTNWQKSQFPKEFQPKIKVIHDGIDTEYFKPDSNAEFVTENFKLSAKDEVITYATRGMEPYRGFPIFMMAIEKLLKTCPNLQVVIAGNDEVYYGQKLTDTTYKEIMLSQLDIDLTRLHFVGTLPLDKYKNLLQISSAHIYLTYPFVLSWSILEAMACGCCVIASNTSPVTEVMQDNNNGLLFDFYNVNQLIEKVEYVLNNQNKTTSIRNNSRQSIVKNYDLKTILPKHIEYIKSLIKK